MRSVRPGMSPAKSIRHRPPQPLPAHPYSQGRGEGLRGCHDCPHKGQWRKHHPRGRGHTRHHGPDGGTGPTARQQPAVPVGCGRFARTDLPLCARRRYRICERRILQVRRKDISGISRQRFPVPRPGRQQRRRHSRHLRPYRGFSGIVARTPGNCRRRRNPLAAMDESRVVRQGRANRRLPVIRRRRHRAQESRGGAGEHGAAP